MPLDPMRRIHFETIKTQLANIGFREVHSNYPDNILFIRRRIVYRGPVMNGEEDPMIASVNTDLFTYNINDYIEIDLFQQFVECYFCVDAPGKERGRHRRHPLPITNELWEALWIINKEFQFFNLY